MAVRQPLHTQLHTVFILHPVLENIKLQRAHNAHHNILVAAAGELEDLNRTLLRNLFHTLDELLALHGVLGRNRAEHLRLKGRDTGVTEFLARHGDGITDGK